MSTITPLKKRAHIKRFKDRKSDKCGMLTFISHTGTKTVSVLDNGKQNMYATWLTQCECGAYKEVDCNSIIRYGQHCGSPECKKTMINRNRIIAKMKKMLLRKRDEKNRLGSRDGKTLQIQQTL